MSFFILILVQIYQEIRDLPVCRHLASLKFPAPQISMKKMDIKLFSKNYLNEMRESIVQKLLKLTKPIKYGLPASPSACDMRIWKASAVDRLVGITTYWKWYKIYVKKNSFRLSTTNQLLSLYQTAIWQ